MLLPYVLDSLTPGGLGMRYCLALDDKRLVGLQVLGIILPMLFFTGRDKTMSRLAGPRASLLRDRSVITYETELERSRSARQPGSIIPNHNCPVAFCCIYLLVKRL